VTVPALRAALAAEGLAWPEPVEWHASPGSTNDVLRERARDGAPAWTAIGADRQTAGRGRQGRAWLSETGNLYLSVLLRPAAEEAACVSLLPLVAGLAVAEAASRWGVAAQLKWPNDVLAGGRKLAGILAEGTSSGSTLDHVVLGIGVNLTAAPAELQSVATSVRELCGAAPSPPAAGAAVLGALRRLWKELMGGSPAVIVTRWRTRSVDWWGREVEVASGAGRVVGRAVGLDADGALLLATGSGTMRVLSGEARALQLVPDGTREGPG